MAENESKFEPTPEEIPENQPAADEPVVEETPEQEKDPKKSPLFKLANELFDILELFVLCAAVMLTLFTFVIRPTIVKGASMEDTLLEGDALLVSDLGYEPKNGDIIVAQNVSLPLYPDPIVKRVIGVGGQTVDIDFTTWTLTVDGKVVDEPYRKLTPDRLRTSDWVFPMEIPEGYVFVMGDNRNHSADSRIADIGLIDERCVVGKAVIRIFPFSRITVFE
ncbi:MAG: signal peptidase I [Clostridia bacterium]|nr:signal peptidase I [Clostridia bacterium]